MDAVKNSYQKFLQVPSKKDIFKIWWDLPLVEKAIMILKQFYRGF